MPGTRKLGRTSDHRKAMLRGMVTYLIENGQIETTVTRAKEVQAMAEKMITIAKDNSLHSKRQVYSYITKESSSLYRTRASSASTASGCAQSSSARTSFPL